MKNIFIVLAAMLAMSTAQAGYWDHNDPKATSTATVSSSTNQHQNQKQNQNQNQQQYAEGGNAGALAGAVSGGNTVKSATNINIEGDKADKYPVSSAITGNPDYCADVAAAQAQNGGFSIGGASAECQAQAASEWFYAVGDKYKDSNPEKAKEFYALGEKWARKAAPGVVQSAIKDTKEVAIDTGVILLVAKGLFGIFM